LILFVGRVVCFVGGGGLKVKSEWRSIASHKDGAAERGGRGRTSAVRISSDASSCCTSDCTSCASSCSLQRQRTAPSPPNRRRQPATSWAVAQRSRLPGKNNADGNRSFCSEETPLSAGGELPPTPGPTQPAPAHNIKNTITCALWSGARAPRPWPAGEILMRP
jgi:hypothetical protein